MRKGEKQSHRFLLIGARCSSLRSVVREPRRALFAESFGSIAGTETMDGSPLDGVGTDLN